ncbi:nuclear pore complex Nup98-Nup96 isoform X1, partial [Brachionus plicatilis]
MTQTENIKIDFLGKLDNLFNEIKREVDSRFEYIIRHESLITSCEQLSSKNLTFSNDNEALNKPTGFNAASSLFSSLQNRTGGLFGNSTTTPTGTENVKFSALSGQDSVTKNGVQSTIQTNHQCITAMKNYQRKSLEELRLEDYQANRKFPQTTSGFGTSSGLFGSSVQSASSGFGSSSLFNSSSTAAKPFGCSSFSTTTTKPSTSTSSFGSQTKPVFGTSATIHPFVVFENSSQRPKPSLDLRPSSQSSTGLFGTRRVSYTGNGLFGPLTPPTMTTGGPLGSSTQ